MIRKLQKADIGEVMRIWLSSNMDAHSFIPEEYWKSNLEMVQEQLAQAEVYVYESGKTIQGFIGMMDDYIAGIFVDQKYRSLGVGKKLLDYVKQVHPILSLGVYRKNRRAVSFYLREGFSVLSEQYDKNTEEPEYIMRWNAGYGEEVLSSTEDESNDIHERLRAYNARYMRETGEFNYHIKENGKIIGGIVASGLGDTLEVEFLYVEEAYRGKGVGCRLLTYVERLAREKGLKRILLNTYSFQAPEFYKRFGYTEVLKLSPAFDEFTQSYFLKNL